MSPFVITTTRPYVPDPSRGDAPASAYEPRASRRAVVTLEDEPDVACQRCAYCLAGQECRFGYVLAKMPEPGGTIGPLADGMTIDVETVTWLDLAERVSVEVLDGIRYDPPTTEGDYINDAQRRELAAVVVAYNARQEASA